MNKINVMEVLEKYNVNKLFTELNIEVVYGAEFMADSDGIVIIPEFFGIRDQIALMPVIDIINKKYGSEIDKCNIEQIIVFAALHEIGHIVDFRMHSETYNLLIVEYAKKEIKKSSRWAKIAALISRPKSKLLGKLSKWAGKKHYEIYRNIPSEKSADIYAVLNIVNFF